MKQPSKIQIVACPTCKKSVLFNEKNPHRPFCSERCKNQDIASWADESYKIPGPTVDPEVEKTLQDQDDHKEPE